MSDSISDLSSFSHEKLYRLNQKKPENDRAQNPQTTEKTVNANLSGIVWTKTPENNLIETSHKKTDKNPLKIKSTDKPQISAIEAYVDQVSIYSAISLVDLDNKFSSEDSPQKQQIMAELARVYDESKSHNSVYERFKGTLSLAAVKARALFNGIDFKKQGEVLARVRQDKLNELDKKICQEYAYTTALFKITTIG